MSDKILRVLHVVRKMDMGGVQSMIMSYYRHIDRTKVQFDFAVQDTNPGLFDEEILSMGGKIYIINPVKKLFAYRKDLKKVIKQNKYTIVHIHQNFANVHGIIVAFFAGVKNIISHSHSNYDEKSFVKKIIKKFLTGIINKLANHKYACSKTAAIWLYGKKAVEKNKTVIIKNAISTEDYKFNAETRRKKREELGLSEKVVIGHTGSFAEGKNHSFLIDIFNEIYKTNENVHMIFMGKGSIEEDMKNKAKSLNLENNISFLGVRTDVNEILNAVDIFVFPSKFEGLGIVLIEAQASGLKCVMSDLVPQEAAVTDLVSVVSLDKSAEEWARCVLKELELSGDRRDMSEIIADNGYDISKEALKLQDEYLKMSNVL